MREAADAGHRIREFAGPALCEVDQLRQRLDSELRRYADRQRLVDRVADRREIAWMHQRQVGRLAGHGTNSDVDGAYSV